MPKYTHPYDMKQVGPLTCPSSTISAQCQESLRMKHASLSLGPSVLCLICAITLATAACEEPQEAQRISLPVKIDASGMVEVTTDLGYVVRLTSAKLALGDFIFQVSGEEHVAEQRLQLLDLLIPAAIAHPGHFEGGAVTGELLGNFIAEWSTGDPNELGAATLLPGRYSSFGFSFSYAPKDAPDKEHAEHTAVLKGVATRDDRETGFTVLLDSPVGRMLRDAPVDMVITGNSVGALNFQLLTASALSDATLFDEVDFQTLSEGADAHITIQRSDEDTQAAYNSILRAFQSLEFYRIQHVQ